MMAFACILCDPMRYPRPETDMQTLQDLVTLYDEPADKRDPETAFLVLADAFRLLHPEGSASRQSTFETIRGEIDGILEKLKPIMEAAVGPAIGGEVQNSVTGNQCEDRGMQQPHTADGRTVRSLATVRRIGRHWLENQHEPREMGSR